MTTTLAVMRISVLLMASVLVAGCSHAAAPSAEQSSTHPGPSASPTTAPSATSSKPSTAPTAAPERGSDIGAVIAWVEAGTSSDVAGFHTATRDGVATDLGPDVAFVVGDRLNCMTDKTFNGALACLTHPTAPLPQPADTFGHWVPGWVDFEGSTVEVGSVHGDPGRFDNGTGPQLPTGHSLAFGDYRCRADGATVVCVNYAHRTAVRLSDGGVEPFGCLKPVTPPASGFGQQFECKPA
ncbi:hypothetical protein ABIA30_000810 [Mycobacterium sp. MAA66]|uniref:hypothetical protein n=1 Tax=Mycobacterium sp. MAA66 TaxID=3156297 RepID=UPI003519731A